jgi:hypothetical protein
MTQVSSYLEYLPSVLWSSDDDQAMLLARMLCVFEKILTGVPDGVPIPHGPHEHEPLETTIDNLHQLFDPWRTRPDFLPWLASCVALTLESDWTEYQRRKLMSEIISAYDRGGLKEGLYKHLDVYVANRARPRIIIDDGEAILRGEPLPDGTLQLHAVAHSNSVSVPAAATTVLLHPVAIAADLGNNYLVADQGDVSLTVPRPPTLWRISSSGEVEYQAGPPRPMPRPILAGSPLSVPAAVLVDAQGRYAVLDIGAITSSTSVASAIYRFAPPAFTATPVIGPSTTPPFSAIHPVDMVLDGVGRFVVLDRGGHPLGDPPAGPAAPRLLVVSEGPLAVTPQALGGVVEPTALVMDSAGRFIIAEAKDQFGSTPADLVRIDPAAGWTASSLLGGVPAGQNPLIFPTGLAFESPRSLLVCDTGARWGYDAAEGDSSYRYLAEPAAIYRVDLSQTPPTITPATRERRLVQPAKLMVDRTGAPVVVDRGARGRRRSWRAGSNEFGVLIYFSRQRPTTPEERYAIRRGVAKIVDEDKPAHTVGWLDI